MQNLSPSPIQQAVGYLALGDPDEALSLFREAAANVLPFPGAELTIQIKRNIYNDPILDQPEFVEVRNRLGFSE